MYETRKAALNSGDREEVHTWGDDYESYLYYVFQENSSGITHLPKDSICQITVRKYKVSGGQSMSYDYYLVKQDLTIATTSWNEYPSGDSEIKQIRYSFTGVYCRTEKYSKPSELQPDISYFDTDFLRYTNFDDNFDYSQSYSIKVYPWIKYVDSNNTTRWRKRFGWWDLNGNSKNSHNSKQALCMSLCNAYNIQGEKVWPSVYSSYWLNGDLDSWEQHSWYPELESGQDASWGLVDFTSRYSGDPNKIWKWCQVDYKFGGKLMYSYGHKIEYDDKNQTNYQFSGQYKTYFAGADKSAQHPTNESQSRYIKQRGFQSAANLRALPKLFQDIHEDFSEKSVKFITISWHDPSKKTSCDVKLDYDDYGTGETSQVFNDIPRDRKLGIAIRVPSEVWHNYLDNLSNGKEITNTSAPIRLPVYQFGPSLAPKIQPIQGDKWYSWEANNRTSSGRYKYSEQTQLYVYYRDLSLTDSYQYLPQLKIKFDSYYYYFSYRLDYFLNNVAKSIRLDPNEAYVAKAPAGQTGFRLYFPRVVRNGDTDNPASLSWSVDSESTRKTRTKWGWSVQTLTQDGNDEKYDSPNGAYKQQDYSSILNSTDASYISFKATNSSARALFFASYCNIDLYGTIETVKKDTFKNFASNFYANPVHPITCFPLAIRPSTVSSSEIYGLYGLDWNYNLVTKSRLLPYFNSTFFPITSIKNRTQKQIRDKYGRQWNLTYGNYFDKSQTRDDFGYNIGVRLYSYDDNNTISRPYDDPKPGVMEKGLDYSNNNFWRIIQDSSYESSSDVVGLHDYAGNNRIANDLNLGNNYTEEYLQTALPVGIVLEY